jgi:hypothetical protein
MLSCRNSLPEQGKCYPIFQTKINKQLQLKEISARLKVVAYFWLSFGIEAFKTGVSQADVSIMCLTSETISNYKPS